MGTSVVGIKVDVTSSGEGLRLVEDLNKGFKELRGTLGSLVKGVAAVGAAFAGFNAFKSFIAEGLEFNQVIETANLGIASLITAQAQLKDGSGAVLTGVEALRAAQVLATDQVNKLRIAGLQTTATTQELVVAFQQAVGVGLRWGLTLDQIRKLTIQMSQAAGALGLPMNQLNEEVRDLLGGNINARNTRIATALGITNEQIRQAQAAGNLFGFVTSRLEAFSVAGEKTAQTFSGVMSNVKEALQNIAGTATAGLFDKLKITGQKALEEIFDMKNARISSKFAGILDVASTVFGELGDMLASAIDAGVAGAEELSNWLKESHLEIDAIFKTAGLLGRTIADLAGSFAEVVVGLNGAATTSGVWKTILLGAGLVVAEIHTALQGITAVLAGLGEGILTLLVKPFTFFLKVAAGVADIFSDTLGDKIAAVAKQGDDFIGKITEANKAYAASLADEGTATDKFIAAAEDADRAVQRQEEHRRALRRTAATTDIVALEAELEDLNKKLAEQRKALAEAKDAQTRKNITNLIQETTLQKERLEMIKKEANALGNVAPEGKGITLKSTATGNQEKVSPLKAEQALTIAAKAEEQERLTNLKIWLDNQLISIETYYDAVTKVQQESIDKQVAAQKVLLAGTTGTDARAKILASIDALNSKKDELAKTNDEKRRQAEIKLQEDLNAVSVDLLKDEGHIADARTTELKDKYRKLIAQLKAEGNTAGVDIVERLFNIETAKARLEEMTRDSKLVTDTLATELEAINVQQEAHAISEAEAREKIVIAYSKARDQLAALVPMMEAFARASKDKEAIQAVEDLKNRIASMTNTIAQTKDDLLQLKKAAADAFQSGLSQFLNDAATGAKSLGDSFRDAARSIINSLRQVAAQMLANLIIQKALAVAKGFGFGFSEGGAVGFASGGYISGAGGPTEDAIPAWLSNGEYVVRASAVRAVGIDFLNSINGANAPGLRPRRRARGYADGGLVAPGTGGDSSHSLNVGLEDGLVVRHLESSAGQKAQITFIEKNATKVKRALGL